ncbi:MAG: methyltransferase [Clostridia bacterium]|nr:methyltransferase [Clostridia bacterium]
MNLKETEHIEYIGHDLKLIVSKAHTFGTDALLLASFAKPSKNALACDFGTGCGIIPFYWLREGQCRQIYSFEIQQNGYDQLLRSIEINGIEKLSPFNCDLRKIPEDVPKGQFDLITMNPPYTKENAGIVSSADSAKIARHGITCSFDDVCTAASKMLKFGGRLCMCLRPERLIELTVAMQKVKIEPKRIRFVSQRDGLAPWLVLVEGKLGRNPGLIVEPELHIENADGEISDEMLSIIGSYRKE